MALLPSLNFDVPGVYVSEDQFGAVPASLASHSAVYMLGYGAKSGAPTETPYFIQSVDDFTNVFGASDSTNSVKLFFAQRPGTGLHFVNVVPKAINTLAIATVTAGATYSITIGGYLISYVATATDTANTIFGSLASQIRSTLGHIASMQGNLLLVASGVSVAVSANITNTITAAPATPTVNMVVEVLRRVFTDDMRQGFIIAPEFFQAFAVSGHAYLANEIEAVCSAPDRNWVGIVDCHSVTATQKINSSGGAINMALAERSKIASPKGHISYYFPYWVDGNDQNVPMSASVVGVALRRYREEGYRQPPAGVKYPVYGVKGISFPVTDAVQSQLNPQGINCGRILTNKGAVIYGARTLSTSPYYRFMTTRVILNVLSGTLSRAFDEVVFSSVDGQGALFGRIKQTAIGICERLRQAGALFGATPEEAYLVVCDRTNNPPLDLERGVVSCDVIVKPSPILEALSIRVSRAALGATLTEAVASGESSTVANSPTTTTTP